MALRPLRVMQSFRTPRPTTNPYIVMLDQALAAEPTIDHVRFSWREALLGRLDVIHFHWPEVLLEGDRPWKRWGKRQLFRLMLLRAAVGGTAFVRTVHNLELPSGLDPATRRLLVTLERRTRLRILLNDVTKPAWESATVVIPHGHYVDWFAATPRVLAAPHTLGFAGLVRAYKGVESLIEAFAQTAADRPQLRLRISGRPTSAALRSELESLAATDARVTLDLRFLDEDAFATAIMSARGIVLPYRHMHNSGAALAALSLSRPVLVPRNEVNTALSAEVGEGWVHQYDDLVDADDLRAFDDAVAHEPAEPPRLGGRDWSTVGAQHADAYRAAVAGVR
ncbi:glycosyltransferase [Propioniciclava flava]